MNCRLAATVGPGGVRADIPKTTAATAAAPLGGRAVAPHRWSRDGARARSGDTLQR